MDKKTIEFVIKLRECAEKIGDAEYRINYNKREIDKYSNDLLQAELDKENADREMDGLIRELREMFKGEA